MLQDHFLLNDDPNKLSHDDFLFFKELIFKLAGLSFSNKKKDLVYSRLRPYLYKNKLGSFEEYRHLLLKSSHNHSEKQNLINILTTNKTDFFREYEHFRYLEEILIPYWIKNNKKDISIWCCASSSGEEPYSLALVLNKYLPTSIKFQLLATDINTQVLSTAKNGVYPLSAIMDIPQKYHTNAIKFGTKTTNSWFKIKDQIHRNVFFKQYNLVEESSEINGSFDLIFCRNVLIYFSVDTIKSVMTKLHKSLKNDGQLIIGHTESIQNCSHLFKSIQPSIFNKIIQKHHQS